jgi:hypothetical protein
MDARRAKTTVFLFKCCACLMVPLHTLKNIAEQGLCKEHIGTVTLPARPGLLLLAFQALRAGGPKPSPPDTGFLHLLI